jgi:hypothetical protein
MTMAALVVVATAYSNCGRWRQTAAVLYVVWALQGTDGWQTMHMEQTESEFNGNIIRNRKMERVFSDFKTEHK